MTGFRDIDGSMVMAGSPDLVCCFADVALQGVLNGKGFGQVSLERLRDIARSNDQSDLVARLDIAEKLIVAAQRLFTYPTSLGGTDIVKAQKAVDILGVRLR